MKTLALTALMVCAAATMHAQDVKILMEGPFFVRPYGTVVMDSRTGRTTIKWESSEDRHIKERDGVWVNNVPLRTIAQETKNEKLAKRDRYSFTSLTEFFSLLTEEGDETVLHCYMKMPADSITNFWLASDETGIIDYETGIHYRARRCEPQEAWYKYFNFTAQKDSTIDFRIYFPKLPETTKEICIYGVPNWGMRGGYKMHIVRENNVKKTYDKKPNMHHPTLVKAAKDYNKNNSGSWSVYKDAHIIKPTEEGTMAMWLTPEATYIAIAHEQNWLREYMGEEKGGMLVDGSGKQYKLKALEDYPLGEIYWVEGYSGDFVATLKVFEPLPLDVETITYIEPDGEPFSAWGANWKGETKANLIVESLRANQKLFEYHKRKIVK